MRSIIKAVLMILVFGIIISNTYQVNANNHNSEELIISSAKYTGIEVGDTFTYNLTSGEVWGIEYLEPSDTVTLETVKSLDVELIGSETTLHDFFNTTADWANPPSRWIPNQVVADDIISALIFPNYGLLDNGTEINMIELFWFSSFNLNLIEEPWLDPSCVYSEESNIANLDCSLENEAGLISKATVSIHKKTGVALHLNTSLYIPLDMGVPTGDYLYQLDLIETNNVLLISELPEFSSNSQEKVVETNLSLETKSIRVLIIIISGFGVAGFFGYYLISSKGSSILTNDKTKVILQQIFNSKTPSFIAIAGSIYKKDRTYGSGTNIPSEMFEFKFLMHPIRLAMMKLLIENPLMTTADLRFQLNLSWGEISNHINSLKKNGLILTENKIIENSVKQVISANPNGIQKFNELSQILSDFFNSPNYDTYLDTVDRVISSDNETDETDLVS